MRVSVIGAGYVGVITAIGLAILGHDVLVMDNDEKKINCLSDGRLPFFETGAEEALYGVRTNHKLSFTTSLAEAVDFAEPIFICVGTPSLPDGSADLSSVEVIARAVAELANSYKCLIEKSTVPAGTSRWILRTLRLYNKKNVEFDVASNPEFLKEGSALHDFLNPDRVVIGASTMKARQLLLDVYQDLDCNKITCDIETAELIKHASNSFLAMKISYANMIGDLCERVGADVRTVTYGMGLDKRIGSEFLNAGFGYGGSCFPKDTKALARMAENVGIQFTLLDEVRKVNDNRIEHVWKKILSALWTVSGKKVGILGLAFKPGTDDVRESPSLRLIERLVNHGAVIRAYDPKAMKTAKEALSPHARDRVIFVDDMYAAVAETNLVVIATEWSEFRDIDLNLVHELMETPIIVDARNQLVGLDWTDSGFEYYPIGIGTKEII